GGDVSRLTALLAAADSERCPALLAGVAFTLTGRGRRASRCHPAPDAAQAGSWLPRVQVGHRPRRLFPTAVAERNGRLESAGPGAKPTQPLELTGRAPGHREGFCASSAACSSARSFGHTNRGQVGSPSGACIWRKHDDQLVELAASGCTAGPCRGFAQRR